MSNSKFVYVIYIRTTAEKLWDALTKPEFTRAYWAGCSQESAWKKGASWKLMIPDGRVADEGEILEIERPKKLVLKWSNEFIPELRSEGESRCTLELDPQGTPRNSPSRMRWPSPIRSSSPRCRPGGRRFCRA